MLAELPLGVSCAESTYSCWQWALKNLSHLKTSPQPFNKSKQAQQIKAAISVCRPLTLQEWQNRRNPADITHNNVTDIQLNKLNVFLPTSSSPKVMHLVFCSFPWTVRASNLEDNFFLLPSGISCQETAPLPEIIPLPPLSFIWWDARGLESAQGFADSLPVLNCSYALARH